MARVTGKYDVDFKRGEGGLSSVFGTFIGTRLKENKEAYARELKAADPTNQYEILKDLMEERRKLVSDMSRLRASPTGGGSVSVSSTDPGTIKMAEKMDRIEEQNREDGADFDFEQGPYILMEREEGQSLKSLIDDNRNNLKEIEQVIEKFVNIIIEINTFN